MSNGETRVSSSILMAGALLALACYGLFFFNLGEQTVNNSEARVLLTVQEMLDSDTWLIPIKGGEGRWETSPLYVWSVRAIASLNNDELTPVVARAPGALCALALALLAAWWTHLHLLRYPREDNPDMATESMALMAGLLVATNPELLNLARTGADDAMFAFLCFAALFCLGESFESRRSYYSSRPWTHWALFGYALIGLAILTKGPAAFLYVIPPYAITAWVYRERRPSKVHLWGTLLALGVGCSWYAFAMLRNPALQQAFLNETLINRIGPDATPKENILFYVRSILTAFFPWWLLSGALVWRTLKRMERTPTRLLWSAAAVSGLVWLTLVPSKRDAFLLPLTPVILLLAADALAHWNYESRPGTSFRVLIRILRWVFVALAFVGSFLIGSTLSMTLAIVLAVASFWLLFHRRRTSYIYDLWERTLHGAWFLIAVFMCAEVIYLRDVMPLNRLYSRVESFTRQAKANAPLDARFYLYGRDDSPIYSYYLGMLCPIVTNESKIAEIDAPNAYLLSDNKVDSLLKNPRLAPVLTRVNAQSGRARAALFKVLDKPVATSDTLNAKLVDLPPLRIAALGNAGEQEKRIKDVLRRVRLRHEDEPIQEILLLGDPYLGKTKLRRIKFSRSFIRTFDDLIDQGIPFNAVLGEADQDIAYFATRFPLAQMGDRRYYARNFRDGLVRFYALDSPGLIKGGEEAEKQYAWLEQELAADSSRWKIVGLFDPLITFAEHGKVDEKLAARLLPLFDKYRVQVVMWGERAVYERIQSPAHGPVFFGTGWSGDADGDKFVSSPDLKAAQSSTPGFLSLEIKPGWLKFRAIDKDGAIVDEGALINRPEGAGEDSGPGPRVLKDADGKAAER